MLHRVAAFFRRWFTGWVGDDQWGEYSRLDRMDFPVTGGCYHGRHALCTNDAGVPCGCGCHQ